MTLPQSPPEPQKPWNWFALAAIVIAIYVGCLVWGIGPNDIYCFFQSPNLNEIGDFLAGFFALPALIMLVAAVATQRQELDETREQFSKSQEVVQQQLDNANNQAEFIVNQQTQAEVSAERAYRLSLFPQRMEIFKRFDRICRDIVDRSALSASCTALEPLAQECLFAFGPVIRDYVQDVADATKDALDAQTRHSHLTMWDDGSPTPEKTAALNEFNSAINKLKSIIILDVRLAKFSAYLTIDDGIN